jgi:hypothetical protein
MKESLEVQIEGIKGKFQINPIPLTRALKLNRKVERLTINALKALESLKEPLIDMFLSDGSDDVSDEEMIDMLRKANIEKTLGVIQEVISTMNDAEFEQFIKEMFKDVKCVVEGLGAVEVTDDQYFDKIFAGAVASIYPLLYEVMKYNNFTPFAVAGIGKLMNKINGSTMPAEKASDSENT